MTHYIEASMLMAKDMARESWYITTIESMKEIGWMIFVKVKDMRDIRMEIFMKGTLWMAKHMEKESILG